MKNYLSLNDMYLSMIRSAYNKGDIEDLKAIRSVLELTPIGIIKDNHISILNINTLEEIIDTKIDTLNLKEEK